MCIGPYEPECSYLNEASPACDWLVAVAASLLVSVPLACAASLALRLPLPEPAFYMLELDL